MKQNPLIVVIDQKDIFEAMRPVLLREFYQPELVHYSTKKEAVDFVHSDVKADIMFVDWHLVNEESFFFKVREDIENHNTPVVIMTEGDHDFIFNNAIKYGITQQMTKPFLDKALLKQINKITSFQEGRRKRRIHPGKQQLIQVKFNGQEEKQLPLIDLSSEGCLLRVSTKLAQKAFIYHQAKINLNIPSYDITIDSEVSRIGHNYPHVDEQDSVLMMLKFRPLDDEEQGKLNDLLDDLQTEWSY